MEDRIRIEPLPYNRRRRTFVFLLLVFIVAIPFLYLYATGYRFDFERPTNLISTGGMYIAVDKTGAEIFIDDELVRETRTFRKAFYAQNLDAGTHRVHVQKEDHHTWVKELPVQKHLVTEAQAFNLPLVPQVQVITPWQSATGSAVLTEPMSVFASTTNPTIATTTTPATTSAQFTQNDAYEVLFEFFSTTTPTTTDETTTVPGLQGFLVGATPTTTEEEATTTVMTDKVKLYEGEDGLYAEWIGNFEQMPYYYCAEEFPPYSTTTLMEDEESTQTANILKSARGAEEEDEPYVLHPVQTVREDVPCEPVIRINADGKDILDFDFFPGSTDLVVVLLDDGIYVVEIDDRAWQNRQPLLIGEDLAMHIENGSIYAYDGLYIYRILLSIE